jgi:hypothetical protein
MSCDERVSLPQMCDVGLLVFDEAHHCKSDHPYNQLLQDFYHALPPQQRPQVGRRGGLLPGVQQQLLSVLREIKGMKIDSK